MAKSESARYWNLKPSTFSFEHRFFPGLSFSLAGAPLHFNPGIPLLLRKHRPNILLVAGGWGMPTNMIASWLARRLDSTRVLFWSESHLRSTRHTAWAVERLRNVLLRQYQAFVVPGTLALEYVQRYAVNKPAYALRNVVDERVFKDRVLEYREAKTELRDELGIPLSKRMLLTVARLAPEKGMEEFLSAISSLPESVSGRFSLVIAGDGPLREQLTALTRRLFIPNVRFAGHLTEDEMSKMYAAADSFLLPSLQDPNPLSVIEALWARLPLLLSDRVGNNPETMMIGENGWVFDPESPDDVRRAISNWTSTSDDLLRLYGDASSRIAEERFCTQRVVREFLDQVLN